MPLPDICDLTSSKSLQRSNKTEEQQTVMSKNKEKKGPSLEDTVKRLETRLREFEDRSAKKIKDLEDLVLYLTNKVKLN